MPATIPRLIADIGGTNARFALLTDESHIVAEQVLPVAQYPSMETAINVYLAQVGGVRPQEAALAIATPITGDYVPFTNYPQWAFSVTALQMALGFKRLVLINDFTALALALPHLTAAEYVAIGGGTAVPETTIGLIGPGTGLGISGLVWSGQRWIPLTTEGGHATFAPTTSLEWEVGQFIHRRFGHVSLERILSGPGLVHLYSALLELDNHADEALVLTPAEITERGLNGTCPTCRRALEMFCAILGSAAGNLALTLGARGGIYIGGGIVPRLGDFFAQSAFRERFEAKGRFRDYLALIPTWVITATHPALRGVAQVFL